MEFTLNWLALSNMLLSTRFVMIIPTGYYFKGSCNHQPFQVQEWSVIFRMSSLYPSICFMISQYTKLYIYISLCLNPIEITMKSSAALPTLRSHASASTDASVLLHDPQRHGRQPHAARASAQRLGYKGEVAMGQQPPEVDV